MYLRKDRALDELAQRGNVAQFVAFQPEGGELRQTHCRVLGYSPNHLFSDPEAALSTLLSASSDRTINLRSYAPHSPRSQEFIYGLTNTQEALQSARRLARGGLFVIANETIDIHDGGVSGVAQGNLVEFAPDDTPRCVEKPGVASFPRSVACSLLSTVYGFPPTIGDTQNARIEFSIHPKPRGWTGDHTVAWEYEPSFGQSPSPTMVWPNRFSRHIGDKAFGLLIAQELGVPVPRTTVFARRLAPFSFGTITGSHEVWLRTCPREAEPGLYTTVKGWIDPFKLLATEDPTGEMIASVICQAAVPARHSGAAVVLRDGDLLVEGRPGEGDGLMLGTDLPEPLPASVRKDVAALYSELERRLGPVRFEWVHDGSTAWIVQLHRGQTESSETVLVPGEPAEWIPFEAARGLPALRATLAALPAHAGIDLIGEVGMTSHLADLARKAMRPARVTAHRPTSHPPRREPLRDRHRGSPPEHAKSPRPSSAAPDELQGRGL